MIGSGEPPGEAVGLSHPTATLTSINTEHPRSHEPGVFRIAAEGTMP